MRLVSSCILLGAVLAIGGVSSLVSAQQPGANAPTNVAAKATITRSYNKFAVQLEVDGSLVGEVKKFDEAGILVLSKGTPVKIYKDGQMVKSVKTDDHGIFQAAKLPPGAYSIMAGDLLDVRKGFSAISVDVVPYVSTTSPRLKKSDVTAVKAPAPANGKLPPRRLPMALIPPADVAFLRQLLVGQFQRAQPAATPAMRAQPRRDIRASNVPVNQSLPNLLATAPGGQPLIARVSKNAAVNKKFERVNGTTFHRPAEFHHQMFLGDDRSVDGNIYSLNPADGPTPVSSAMIYYRRNKVVQAQAVVKDGMFHAKGLTPGVYSVIVVTPSSFGAFAIEYLPIYDDFDSGEPESDAKPVPAIKQASFALQETQPPPTDTTVPSDDDSRGYLRDQIGANNTAPLAGNSTAPAGGVGGGAAGPEALAALATAAAVGLGLSQSDESPQVP